MCSAPLWFNFWVTTCIVILGLGHAAAQTSPGPMSAVHAGVTSCDACHADITQGAALAKAKCVACHVALGARIAAGHGLHASKVVAGKQCESCHHEHRGASYDPTGWTSIAGGRDGFDHALTGWPLEGAHRLPACSACHRAQTRYVGTSPQCLACHAQPHGIGRAALLDCVRCHTTRAWRPPRPAPTFDHDADARMPLRGAHAGLSCAKCHPRALFNLQLANATRCDNSGCHRDPHAGQLFDTRPCEACHVAAFDRVTFDHKAFELAPAHAQVACTQCHTASLGAKRPSPRCEDCHHTAVPRAERGFSHDAHAAAKPVACIRCHATRSDSLAASHARCEGAGCHTAFAALDCKVVKAAKVERVCATCHRSRDRTCAPPPATPARTVVARFGHATHASLGAPADPSCAVCHDAAAHGGAAVGDAHAICATCHTPGAALPMATCTGCHEAAPPRALVVLRRDPLHVAKHFRHDSHARRAIAGCTSCHRGPEARAAMPACGACHASGSKVFAVTSHCARCHDEPVMPPDAVARFSHAGAHARPCTACHDLDTNGLVDTLRRGKDHLPCAEAGCHGTTDFAARSPTMCVVCHATWSQPRRVPRQGDWFQRVDHARHLVNPNMACTTCHAVTRNHETCAPCHAKGQPPALAQCDACHTQTPQSAPASPWSVASRFSHATHATDPRTATPATCATCHVDVASAARLADIARPTMASCEACHDGLMAFKTTGFGCARCHRR